MTDALVRRESDIGLTRAPEDTLADAKRAATALRNVIGQKEKPVIINGEVYLEFEDWSTVASFYGVSGGADDAVPVDINGIQGAKASGYVVRTDTGIRISSAVAYCLRDEENWEDKPWFQLASMAQTRATAKALRNVLSRVVVLAGYKATPAEEMGGIGTPKKRIAVFPFGANKGKEPSELPADDLHRELDFWQKKSSEETNPKFKANNDRLLAAIQEALAEKTAPPTQPEPIDVTPKPPGDPSPLEQARIRLKEFLEVHKDITPAKIALWCHKTKGCKLEELDALGIGALIAYLSQETQQTLV